MKEILSPNFTKGRKHSIDTLTIHCAVAECKAERLGEVFKNPERKASCNYAIGFDGSVCRIVKEEDRSWCSSSSSNDNRAITFEVASKNKAPYEVTDKALETLIDLIVDICKRHNITKVTWLGDNKEVYKNYVRKPNEAVFTLHKWFASKSCPGAYLISKHPYIEAEVNKRLSTNYTKPVETNVDIHSIALEVIQGKWGNGAYRKTKLLQAGYNYSVIQNEVNKILGGGK